jgi:hypothetical protein
MITGEVTRRFWHTEGVRWSLLMVLALVATACGGGSTGGTESSGEEANLAIVANSPTTLGTGIPQRILVGLIDPETNESLALPDRAVTVEITSPDQRALIVDARFLWIVPEVRGLYAAAFTFDAPGVWSLRVLPNDLPRTPASPFQVLESPSVPEVGEPAVASKTRTSVDYELAEITTDPDPDPSFYQLSLDEALGNGKPTVVIFATPAFCQSAACGPMLDVTKAVAPSHPGVNFIHVEVYENLDAQSFEELRPVAAVTEWGFISEPWAYVIDAAGIVTARFEGTYTAEELEAALAALDA